MAEDTNPYHEAGVGAGARAAIWDSYKADLNNNVPLPIADAKAKEVFFSKGGTEQFMNVVTDTFKDHFAGDWDMMALVSMDDDDDDDEVLEDVASLIPRGESYIREGKNVLLIGPHGTGKTFSIQALAKKMNIKMKYFSCSTMDPYTDLVGVPVPTQDPDGALDPNTGMIRQNLVMVREHDIDQAELIFFDEFNRADSQTMNAVFEIIQFGTINGEKLPNLKACWAAMNPADGDYTVSETDPALLDRFHAYIKMEPAPSVAYMKQFMDVKVAKALLRWWGQHVTKENNKKLKTERMSYISPRRLQMLGEDWMLHKSGTALLAVLPPSGDFDSGKLIDMLEKASGMKEANPVDKALGFDLEKGFIMRNQDVVGAVIKDDLLKQQAVLECLFKGTGPARIFSDYDEFINKWIIAGVVETVVNNLPPTKKSNLKGEYLFQFGVAPKVAESLLYRVLTA